MRKRYHCPSHEEKTPSAIVYGARWHCFGCGANGSVEQLGLKPDQEDRNDYVENIEETVRYIRSLPKGNFRGLQFHANSRGFYILWPNNRYYKHRLFGVDTPGGKYRGPTGVSKTPFILNGISNGLVLVEGELNALSLKEALPDLTIVSPGGAGDFYSRGNEKYLSFYTRYHPIFVFTDNDAAGAQAAIEMKSRLIVRGAKDVRIKLLDTDFNDTLVKDGLNALREEARTYMDLPRGVSGSADAMRALRSSTSS